MTDSPTDLEDLAQKGADSAENLAHIAELSVKIGKQHWKGRARRPRRQKRWKK